jgi:chromosomal replication initiator protein
MLTPLADVEQSTPSISTQDAWHLCLLRLSQEIDPQIFSAYFEPLELIEGNAESFSIGAPNRFICSQLDRHFRDKLTGVLNSILGSDSVNVSFSVSEQSQQPQARLQNTGSASRQASLSQATLSNQQSLSLRSAGVARAETNPVTIQSPIAQRDQVDNGDSLSGFGRSSAINPKYSFDNFVVGSSNQFCHAAALRVAESPGNSYNPLFIYGGVGLGKTHLLHSIGNEVLRRNPKATILYLSSEAFTNELILALRQAKMDEFKKRMRNIEVLLIDDIQFISGKERTQEEFFHTFNALYSAKRQIVITSDKIPSEIPGIEERLQTRFSWGLMADLQAPDFETRVAILNRKAAVDQVALPEEVAHLVAERVSSNVRELEGALTRLHALSSLQNVPITLKSASATLEPLLQPKTINVSIDDIKKAVATHFNLKVADMTSKRRTKNLSFPRHIAMYLCRKHTTCSYPEIGGQFGGRDHSSVIHAASVVSAKVASDAKVKEMIEGIERNLLTP